MFKLAIILALLSTVCGYSHYQDRIPNGKIVPHPCKPNYLWKGVGHKNILGGGVRNPFGEDFAANGHKWDKCLCERDSDGDGKTNGEELGDPDCVWTVGTAPASIIGLSHPGVCEPVDSVECLAKNKGEIDCSSPEFSCEALEKDQDVKEHIIHLDETAVPGEETTYICQGVTLPDEGDYHIIAVEPRIINEDVAHHMILYGCHDNMASAAQQEFGEPKQCGMNAFLCSELLALWTVGINGMCFDDKFGVKIGKSGFKYGIIEIHWNNPQKISDYVDSSGFKLHYTPNLRTYDMSTLFVGPNHLELPPGQKKVTQEGHCPAECTNKMLSEKIYVHSVLPHMHYSGRGMKVEQRRAGSHVKTLIDVAEYNYDNPEIIEFEQPVVLLPGDEITVECIFETTNLKEFVFFGEATSDEMCIAVISYYPRQANSGSCYAINEVGWCDGDLAGNHVAADCFSEYNELFETNNTQFEVWVDHLSKACDPTGWNCFSGCRDAIREVRRHACLKENLDHIVLMEIFSSRIPPEFIRMMASCDIRPYPASPKDTRSINTELSMLCRDDEDNGARGMMSQSVALVLVIGAILYRFVHESY